MARSDLLLDLIRAGSRGDPVAFRRVAEALIAEERGKKHHVLADRLSQLLRDNGQLSVQAPTSTAPASSHDIQSLVLEESPDRSLADLILPEVVESTLLEVIEEQHRADLLRAHNLEPRHRILLAGPPGNGKTSLAEAIAHALLVPLITVRYEGVIGSYLGETSARLRRVFEHVRARRCVLFFDEFDAVAKERGDVHETGEIKRVVSSLLLQVDSLPSYVTVVTASNHPELLDTAVWRRFQVRLNLPRPTTSQIKEWFRRFQEEMGAPLGRSLDWLAKNLAGASFSELEDFTLDVRRRYVLQQPHSELSSIVTERLNQWRGRFQLVPE